MKRTPRETQKESLTIGQQIRRARQDAGMTQEQLIRKIFVTKTYLSHLENDKADPSLALLRRIYKATGTALSVTIGPALDERSFRDRGD